MAQAEQQNEQAALENWLSIAIAVLALGATLFEGMVARSNEQVSIFAQFQEAYSAVAARFPSRLLEPDFHPVPASDDYKKLEDYWIFAYAEWFETERNKPFLGTDLWRTYYSGLITDALEVPSLRYVAEDMMNSGNLRRKDMGEFFATLRDLAAKDGRPLGALHEAK